MAGAFTLADALPVLKEHYNGQTVVELTYTDRVLFGTLPKKTGVGGKVYPKPIRVANTAGRSARFADAVAARGGTVHKEWLLTHVDNFGTATVDHKTMRLLAGDRNGFIEQVTTDLDATFENFANDLQQSLYGDGTGVRGVVSAVGSPGANDITLTNVADHRHFYIGQMLDHAATATGATVKEYPRVTAIDSNNGIITVDSIGTIAATNFLFQRGDAADGGAKVKNEGLASILPDPATITLGDNYFGVDRSLDKRRLLGQSFDGSALTKEQAILRAAAQSKTNEGSPKICLMNPVNVATLMEEVEQRGRYAKWMASDAKIFYDSIQVYTPAGLIDVVPDSDCPEDLAYLLDPSTFEIFSTDPLPMFVSEDGDRLHRLEQANEVEFRIGGYYNVCCVAPGKNTRIEL